MTYDMKFNAIERAMTSYLEYAQICEGKRRDREFHEWLCRQSCYYSTTMTRKDGSKLKPSDLWPIGDEDGRNISMTAAIQQENEDLHRYGKRKGILIA